MSHILLLSAGLLYVQNGDSLTDLSGFNALLHVNTLVLALLGEGMTIIDDFSSLFTASRIYITRNSVSLTCDSVSMIVKVAFSAVQELEVISGFQRLRYLEVLIITDNPKLVAVDGLWGVREVTLGVTIRNNPMLCYSLGSLSDMSFWQVKNVHNVEREVFYQYPLPYRIELLRVLLSVYIQSLALRLVVNGHVFIPSHVSTMEHVPTLPLMIVATPVPVETVILESAART